MFEKEIYIKRRETLKKLVGNGVIILFRTRRSSTISASIVKVWWV